MKHRSLGLAVSYNCGKNLLPVDAVAGSKCLGKMASNVFALVNRFGYRARDPGLDWWPEAKIGPADDMPASGRTLF